MLMAGWRLDLKGLVLRGEFFWEDCNLNVDMFGDGGWMWVLFLCNWCLQWVTMICWDRFVVLPSFLSLSCILWMCVFDSCWRWYRSFRFGIRTVRWWVHDLSGGRRGESVVHVWGFAEMNREWVNKVMFWHGSMRSSVVDFVRLSGSVVWVELRKVSSSLTHGLEFRQ